MNGNYSQKAQGIVTAALGMKSVDRAAFLDQACGNNRELRAEVDALLAADATAAIKFDETTVLKDMSSGMLAADAAESNARAVFALKFKPGEILANRFRIIKFIDSGGMGDVYQAEDLELGENVALKTIRPEIAGPATLARFKREIHLSKRISHPNVCRIHDLGVHHDERGSLSFLTMEFLPGQTLADRLQSGPLPLSEAAGAAEQIASGISAAHACGVLHLDLKTRNIMLVKEGENVRAVVTDFGLARTISKQDANAITLTGQMAGTPEYMAPEQVVGTQVSLATDIYAFGLILFEMVTGAHPFRAQTPLGRAAERLTRAPLSPRELAPGLPLVWERVILRCLERDPAARFKRTGDVIEALQSGLVQAPPTDILRSRKMLIGILAFGAVLLSAWALWQLRRADSSQGLAIMPFSNSDPSTAYFREGLTDDLAATLGELGVRVIGRDSVGRYLAGHKDVLDPIDAGHMLKVRNLVKGHVSASENHFVVTVEAIDCRTNQNLWRRTYEYEHAETASSIPKLRQDIAKAALQSLRMPLTSDGQKIISRQPTSNEEAYTRYLKGRLLWNDRNQVSLRKACQYFQDAIQLDPNYAQPYSGLADCSAMQAGRFPPMQEFPPAEKYARKSIKLDPSLAEGYASLAFIDFYYNWNWSETEREYDKAIKLNPSDANARSHYSMYLAAMRRFDSALEQANRARHDDWLDPAIQTGLGRVYLFEGSYSRAIAEFNEVLKLTPQFDEARSSLASALAETGRAADLEEAITQLQQVLKSAKSPEDQDSGSIAELAYLYGKVGRPKRVQDSIASLSELATKRYVSPFYFAVAYAALGDRDKAFEYLHRGIEDKAWQMVNLEVVPSIASLRNDARWKDVVKQIGLQSQ